MRTNKRKKSLNSSHIGDLFICGAYFLMLYMVFTGKINPIINKNEMLKNVCLIDLSIIILLLILCEILRKLKKIKTNEKYLNSTLQMVDTMSGVEFEEYLKVHFEYIGYKVTLTPKSNDYGIDLICKKRHKTENEQENGFVIQAKRYSGKVGVAAVQQVIAGAKYYDCKYGMVITNSYFTNNAWELAKKSGIILWDRSMLNKEFFRSNLKSKKMQKCRK